MAEAESRAQGEISRMRAQLEDASYSHAETDAQLSTREVRIFAVNVGFVLGWMEVYVMCSLSRGRWTHV